MADQVIKGDVTLGEAYATAVEEQAGYNTLVKSNGAASPGVVSAGSYAMAEALVIGLTFARNSRRARHMS
jgi:hypothetical protein